ncbi:MAG: glycoside hydrolase family 43 protein [Candidatus Marinimicrobia bacterium]|nr:glycoside hydrolase family 43 protein [Candidatus Neomarinimicrobiota bacterium]
MTLGNCTRPEAEVWIEREFTNPIFAGYYPDPSLCQAGDDYYLVHSTFCHFPGIPVFHSKDLIDWELIGHVLNRPDQYNTTGLEISRGIFAPAISYHNGTFYIVNTLVDCGGNFITTAQDPAGPWSDPVLLPEINGIDPSLFFDDNDSAYIVYNSDAPDNRPLYSGHRTIRLSKFNIKNLKVTSKNKILVNGGVDISQKPVWIEGPHILKKDSWYYLVAAEGGTGENHSQVVFRSKKVDGPFIPWTENPILTQRHLDPHRKNPITSTGHADLFTAPDGSWWAVFLGCRPYEDNHYNTGRETFMAPVHWNTDGWPVINPGYDEIQNTYTIKTKPQGKLPKYRYSGNFTDIDDFDEPEMNPNWIQLRTPSGKWHLLDDGKLIINLRPETAGELKNPSFIAHRQQHINSTIITAMNFSPKNENEKAGLLVFQNARHHYFLCKAQNKGFDEVHLYQSSAERKGLVLLASVRLMEKNKGIILKVSSSKEGYGFYYGNDKNHLNVLAEKVDGKFLSTKVAGGFVGVVSGMYATSTGLASSNSAAFDWFEYMGQDDF